MNKKLEKMNIGVAVNMADEIQQMASSLTEDVADSTCMTDAWKKIDKFYQDIEKLRNMQKCTGSKGFSVLHDSVKGHTKYLQGIDLPIMVNSIWKNENYCVPSSISEMYIGTVDGKLTLLITPESRENS